MERLARGTGPHARLESEGEWEEAVARVAHELQGTIHELVHVLQPRTPNSVGYDEQLEDIRWSLRLVTRLARELAFVLTGGEVEGHTPSRPIRASRGLCGASVLLVGQDLEWVQSVSRILREEGVTPVTATSAPECLVRVAAQRPEVVVIDTALGSSLGSMLATVAPQIPIVFTTPASIDHTDLVSILERVLIEPHARMRVP